MPPSNSSYGPLSNGPLPTDQDAAAFAANTGLESLSRRAVSRRSVVRGALLGAGALGVPAVLAGCGGGPAGGGKTVTLGSNASDEKPKKTVTETMAAFGKKSGKTVKVNTVDHNTFQENINRYLKGSPDDAFTWFAGFRMQYFAKQGLATEVSDVWSDIGGEYSDAFKQASTGEDGKQYFVPTSYYPWAIFYRKSVWQQRGYAVPKTLDELTALCKKMQTDGLVPFAFADKDGWPAMGTFDHLNLRINGYDFHMGLMRGKEAWTDPKVKQVFDTWRGLLPYHQPGANGRTWQEAAQAFQQKKTGMYLLGLFVGQQFGADEVSDLDFFPYPEINSEHGQDAIEAPIDGYMVSKKAKNVEGAKELLRYLGTAESQEIALKLDPTHIAASNKIDASTYDALRKKAVDLVSNAKQVAQFLDRDTLPAFASTVMIPSLQRFINEPTNIDPLLRDIEAQKKNIFASGQD